MKTAKLLITTLIFFLLSFQSKGQITLETLQKLATLNISNDEFRNILKFQGYKNIGSGEWIKKSTNSGREIIKIIVTTEGNHISYKSINIPQIKGTVESIKKLGNIVFNENDNNQIHFRNTDKKQFYEVIYSGNYSPCAIVIFPYKDIKNTEIEKPKEVEESTVMVAISKNAEYLGGQSAMAEFISQNLEIPKDASDWSGKVMVNFFIDKDGSVQDVSVQEMRNPIKLPISLKDSIISTFKKMPTWTPAEDSNGNAVRSIKKVPLTL